MYIDGILIVWFISRQIIHPLYAVNLPAERLIVFLVTYDDSDGHHNLRRSSNKFHFRTHVFKFVKSFIRHVIRVTTLRRV